MNEHKPCPLCGCQMTQEGANLWCSCGTVYDDTTWDEWDNGGADRVKRWFYSVKLPELDAKAAKDYAEHQRKKRRGW